MKYQNERTSLIANVNGVEAVYDETVDLVEFHFTNNELGRTNPSSRIRISKPFAAS